MELTTNASIYLAVVALTYIHLLLYCIQYVRRYKHEYDSNVLATSVVIVCLLVVLLITFLLPADIFMASFVKTEDGNFKDWATKEMLTKIDTLFYGSYYAVYGTVIFMIVALLPFMHFLNDQSMSSNRIIRACMRTIWFTVAACLLLLIGAFVPVTQRIPGGDNSNSTNNNSISDSFIINFNKTQDAINLIMTFVTLFGLFNVVFYTASGIMSWPLGLIIGTLGISSRTLEINERELDLRRRITALEEKARSGALNNREQESMTRAKNELRLLEQEETTLTDYTTSLSYKFRKLVRPVQIGTGLFVLILSILMVVNLGIVGYDRFMNGLGPKKGYVIEKSTIFNPMQYIFNKVHNMIIVGPMPMLIVNCILVIATLSGMRNLGLWLLIARIYKIRLGRTQPQAMLYFCGSLMLAVLSFSILFYSMTPEYITFGSQNFRKVDGNATAIVPCNLAESGESCIRTRLSTLLVAMMSQVWIFGALFYWMTWAFQFMAVLSLIVVIFKGKREATHGLIDNEESFEE